MKSKNIVMFTLLCAGLLHFTACNDDKDFIEKSNNPISQDYAFSSKQSVKFDFSFTDKKGRTWRVRGEIAINREKNVVMYDITITTPKGKELRFIGAVFYVQAGNSSVEGDLTDVNGKPVEMTEELHEFLIELTEQMLCEK